MKSKGKRIQMKWLLCIPMLGLSGCASFELSSTPSANIHENGEKISRTPYNFELVAEARVFTLKSPGYVDLVVPVSPLDRKRLYFELEPVRSTDVESLPVGAKVTRVADGEVLGATPCHLPLSRPDQVRVELDGFKSVELELIPNRQYVLKLSPSGGYEAAFYRSIIFESDQGAVEIYDRVAGEVIGTTPVRVTLLAGRAIEYRLNGFSPETAIISRTGAERVQIELEPITVVTLRGPEGAAVYRAGGSEPVGTLPYTVEINGDTLFEVRKEGRYPETIAVAPGVASDIDVELKRIPYKTIVTQPAGAEIYRLGGVEVLGKSPFTTIVEGERLFEIKKPGYKSEVIGVGAESPEQVSVSLDLLPQREPDATALGTLDNLSTGTH